VALLEEMTAAVQAIAQTRWSTRRGQVVPDPEDVRLGNDAVEFDRATVLYADLNGSTNMVDTEAWQLSAEIYKAFLHCAATIIRKRAARSPPTTEIVSWASGWVTGKPRRRLRPG
jgi:class 3 adenylate cyclase